MVSRAVHNEIAYGFRMLFSTLPSLRASTEQRSNFELFKALVFESYAAVEPAAAAQALQLADKARAEAHGIATDY